MSNIAIVFPGQASQYVGMGRDLYDAEPAVRRLYELASDEIGEDIARLSFDGPADSLKQTRFTQPAILLHSLAVFTLMKDDMPEVALTAGHSLGEFGALALAGVLSIEDAVRAVVRRAALMQAACEAREGTMAAIMGLDEKTIEDVCREASAVGVVVPANFNSSIQTVISGTVAGVEDACRRCKERGAKRAVLLQVGGAFHSPLMEPAAIGLRKFLDSLEFLSPTVEIVPNVTAVGEKNPQRIKELLVAQITSPVKWQQTMEYFNSTGIDIMVEAGPGKVLTGLAKRAMTGTRLINIDSREDVEQYTPAGIEES